MGSYSGDFKRICVKAGIKPSVPKDYEPERTSKKRLRVKGSVKEGNARITWKP